MITNRNDFEKPKRRLCTKCSDTFVPEKKIIKICPICSGDLKKIQYYKDRIQKRRSKNQYNMSTKIIDALEEIQEHRRRLINQNNYKLLKKNKTNGRIQNN